jgi:glycosyltransferase involved in cell wall biosynthesis
MKIAAVIPSYNVKPFILDVLARIPDYCDRVYVVDDKCPMESGRYVEEHNSDPRVTVIFNEENQGVGGAVLAGFRRAFEDGADICVKIDGDGQMDPGIMYRFTAPIANGDADYTKGNRFYSVYTVRQMPAIRLFGNAALSFLTKLSSGYWSLFDPTNGYIAIHRKAFTRLASLHVSKRYFFESDMLIHLRDIDAVIKNVPMEAVYGDERSGLHIRKIFSTFLFKNMRMFIRRVIYQYFLRDFNVASLNIVLFLLLTGFGVIFGGIKWMESLYSGVPTPAGTVMVAVLPIILGFQSLIFAVSIDVQSEPKVPLQNSSGSTPWD